MNLEIEVQCLLKNILTQFLSRRSNIKTFLAHGCALKTFLTNPSSRKICKFELFIFYFSSLTLQYCCFQKEWQNYNQHSRMESFGLHKNVISKVMIYLRCPFVRKFYSLFFPGSFRLRLIGYYYPKTTNNNTNFK